MNSLRARIRQKAHTLVMETQAFSKNQKEFEIYKHFSGPQQIDLCFFLFMKLVCSLCPAFPELFNALKNTIWPILNAINWGRTPLKVREMFAWSPNTSYFFNPKLCTILSNPKKFHLHQVICMQAWSMSLWWKIQMIQFNIRLHQSTSLLFCVLALWHIWWLLILLQNVSRAFVKMGNNINLFTPSQLLSWANFFLMMFLD